MGLGLKEIWNPKPKHLCKPKPTGLGRAGFVFLGCMQGAYLLESRVLYYC